MEGNKGFTNCGNTCYMNASLQCLGHVRPLVEYFRSEAYISDIHSNSAMGSKMAELADGYGTLVCDSWGAQAPRAVIAPRHFKKVLGRFNEDFVGYNQQDAQEFIDKLCTDSSLEFSFSTIFPFLIPSISNKLAMYI